MAVYESRRTSREPRQTTPDFFPAPGDPTYEVGSRLPTYTPPTDTEPEVRGPAAGQPAQPSPDDYWNKYMAGTNVVVAAAPGGEGAWFDTERYNADLAAFREFDEAPSGGDTGVSAAISAQAANLGTFVSAAIASVQADIDARRLTTEQAMDEFNRRLDAMQEAGSQYTGLQQYTVPKGSTGKSLMGPLRESLGMDPWISNPSQYDPFAAAQAIVDATPDLTELGVPGRDPLQEALDIARSFV